VSALMAAAAHMYMLRFASLVTKVRISFTNHVGSFKGGDDLATRNNFDVYSWWYLLLWIILIVGTSNSYDLVFGCQNKTSCS
jgi:UDP-N-acetylmuramyl pentapeptide phosphotransferase/UDP-N-acetylglucosamine-1-phosphate transferase